MFKDSDYIKCETCHKELKGLIKAFEEFYRDRDICVDCYDGAIKLCSDVQKMKKEKGLYVK